MHGGWLCVRLLLLWLLMAAPGLQADIANSTTPSEPALVPVRVQLEWKYQFEFAGFIAAIEKGYYREVGLAVELIEYEPGSDNIRDLLAGPIDFAIHNSSIAVDNGRVLPVVQLASYFQRSPLILVTRPDIRLPADLIGKTLMGTTEELKYSSLAQLLEHFGVARNNTEFLEHSFNNEDFISGKVDAMTAFRSNQLYELDRRNIPYSVIDPADFGFISTAVNIITSAEKVIADPDKSRRFVDASNRGWQYALNHPEEVIDIILAHYSQQKSREALIYEAQVTRTMMQVDLFPIGKVSEDLGRRAFQQLQRSGMLEGDQQYSQLSFDELMARQIQGATLPRASLDYLRERGIIRYCVNPSLLPLEGISNGRHVGVMAEMFEHVREEMLPITLELVPTASWQESQNALQQRRCDVITAAAATAQRNQYASFSEPWFDAAMVIATTIDTPFIDDIANYPGRTVGVLAGAVSAEMLQAQFGSSILIQHYASVDEGLRAVENGEIFGFYGTVYTLSNAIQRDYASQLKISARLDRPVELAFAVRNDEPELLTVFDLLAEHLNSDTTIRQEKMNKWVSVREQSGISPDTILKVLAGLAVLLLAVAAHYVRLHRYSALLETLSITDPLTGLYNRVHGDKALQDNHARYKRYGENCALMMLDIDNFKQINDRFGHAVGDAVLTRFAKLLRQHLRATDIACRWGGEEFLVISPHCDANSTRLMAEKFLTMVRATDFGEPGIVTLSIGVSDFRMGEDMEHCMRLADEALYRAKSTGKDRVCLASATRRV